LKDLLDSKIDNYCGYVVQAIKKFKILQYSDSAANCRKAAEAACKILFFHVYSQKPAEEKTANKTLRELISQVVRDQVAERKAINNLEALQITGNEAAHDNVISKEEAAYTLNALNLLTLYLFNEKLKIHSSASPNFETKEKEPQSRAPEIIEKMLLRETTDPAKDADWLQKLNFIEKQNEQLTNLVNEITREIKQYVEWESVSEITVERVLLDVKTKNKKNGKRIFAISTVMVIIAITTGVFYFLNLNKNSDNDIAVLKSDDRMYVAINAPPILQDNPNIDFKLARILRSSIERIAVKQNLQIKCISTDFKKTDLSNDTTVMSHARLFGYDVIYWFNLYKSAPADSNILEIKGTLAKEPLFFHNKKIKFKYLTDSTFKKEINDRANITIVQYCGSHDDDENYYKLANILGSLKTYSEENFLAINDGRSNYLFAGKDYNAALKLLKKCWL